MNLLYNRALAYNELPLSPVVSRGEHYTSEPGTTSLVRAEVRQQAVAGRSLTYCARVIGERSDFSTCAPLLFIPPCLINVLAIPGNVFWYRNWFDRHARPMRRYNRSVSIDESIRSDWSGYERNAPFFYRNEFSFKLTQSTWLYFLWRAVFDTELCEISEVEKNPPNPTPQ